MTLGVGRSSSCLVCSRGTSWLLSSSAGSPVVHATLLTSELDLFTADSRLVSFTLSTAPPVSCASLPPPPCAYIMHHAS